MTKYAFERIGTGGGCEAYELTGFPPVAHPDGWQIASVWITEEDDPSVPEYADTPVVVGYYDEAHEHWDEPLHVYPTTVVAVEAVAKRLDIEIEPIVLPARSPVTEAERDTVLGLLADNDGAMLCWQVENSELFERACKADVIQFDAAHDLYVHPLAFDSGDGGYTMMPSAALVAARFVYLLQEEMHPREFVAMHRRNSVETQTNVCHSHDFLDANLVMDLALNSMGATEKRLGEDERQELWNAAWDLARPLLGHRK